MTGEICDFALIVVFVFVFCIAAIEGHLARRFFDNFVHVFVCGCLGREGSSKEEEKEGIWVTAALYVQPHVNHNHCIDRGKRTRIREKLHHLSNKFNRRSSSNRSYTGSLRLGNARKALKDRINDTLRFLERLQHQWIIKQLFPGARRSLTVVMASHHLLAARNLMIHRTRSCGTVRTVRTIENRWIFS